MKKYAVFVTDPAARDIEEIAYYIAHELREPVTARNQIGRIKEAVFSLSNMPFRHTLVAEPVLAEKGVRSFIVDHYLVFYTVNDTSETATIIRILYGKRDWVNLL